MANRLVTKALAGIQDLLLGRQTVVQARASGNVNITGIYADNIPHDLAAGLTIHGKLGQKVEVVTNIAALQALDTDAVSFAELYVYVQGYFTATDGGGGLFWLDASDTSSAEDLKYIFNPDTLANGRWKRVDPDDQLTNDNGDASIVLTAASYKNQLFNTNFTANRTATLSTTGLYKGKTFRIIRTNTAAYTLTLVNITPSVVLAASEATTIEITWDGTAWQQVSKSVQVVSTVSQLVPYDAAKFYFAHESATPNMTVLVDAGRMLTNDALITNAQQSVVISAAHASLSRIDRIAISEETGVYTLTAGTPNASPVAPGLAVGQLPICQILIPALDTAITNSQITDERILIKLGAGPLGLVNVASAVNKITLTNAATGNAPVVSVTGTDANISLQFAAKGTGATRLLDGNGNEVIVIAAGIASAVNEVTITNAGTAGAPTIGATGDDANINLSILAKGTGSVNVEGASFTNDTANMTTANIATANITTCLATNLQSANVVGSYILAWHETLNTGITLGTSYAGSLLTSITLYLNGTNDIVSNGLGSGSALTGTWKALSPASAVVDNYGGTLFVRTV